MRSFSVLIVALVCALPLNAQDADQASLGRKVPDFQFDKVVMNGDGFFGGDAYLGQPVLYEFWGFR